jgi:hypothetical protein
MFCLNMMQIALELARENDAYERMATKFFEHYNYIGVAMTHMGERDLQLWDDEAGFFYDMLHYPDGRFQQLRVRSLVGLIPLYATGCLDEEMVAPYPSFRANLEWFLENRTRVTRYTSYLLDKKGKKTYVLSNINREQMTRLLDRVFDPAEFLSDFGLRSLSRAHRHQKFSCCGDTIQYEPGEAESKIKGGNSNWRGPIWFPTGFLMIEALCRLGLALGDDLRIRVEQGRDAKPGSLTLAELAGELADRMIRLFVPDRQGDRPVYGVQRRFQEDPHWRDLMLFHEYFHGDTGCGLGASHQTGWTALVAVLIFEWRQ